MMPYIRTEQREKVNKSIEDIVSLIGTTGELNYVITRLFHKFILKCTLCYDMLNSMIGVLECAKLELYRMVAAPYENKKRFDNGCISELDTVDGKSY